MNADLYICDSTFAYNGSDSNNEVCQKVLRVCDICSEVRKHADENSLYVNIENLLNTRIFNNKSTIKDVLIGNKSGQFPRDFNIRLLTLIAQPRCKFSHKDMMDVLSIEYEDDEHINGIVAMNEIAGIDKNHQVLYDSNGFYEFRRYFIGKYPKDSETFLKNINKYYDNIELNSDRRFMVSHIKDVMDKSMDIVKALSALNDHFIHEFKKEMQNGNSNLRKNINDFLDAFAKNNAIDGGSTGEFKHKKLYCKFTDNSKILYCGPHLKYNYNHKEKLRIYFCWDNNNPDKVYVGLICRHI